jgi:hypothetical protein
MTNNEAMKTLEQRVDKLEDDLISCGVEKDARINSMHGDMKTMHSDMGAMKNTIESLTEEIRCAVQSLKQIAQNTTSMSELTQLYDKWKGFTWVMRNIGFWGALILAFTAGIVITLIKVGGA